MKPQAFSLCICWPQFIEFFHQRLRSHAAMFKDGCSLVSSAVQSRLHSVFWLVSTVSACVFARTLQRCSFSSHPFRFVTSICAEPPKRFSRSPASSRDFLAETRWRSAYKRCCFAAVGSREFWTFSCVGKGLPVLPFPTFLHSSLKTCSSLSFDILSKLRKVTKFPANFARRRVDTSRGDRVCIR